MGRQYFVFLFRLGTEQPHQGDMNNSNSPNMFLIHKKYISRTQSDQKIRYKYSATFCVQHKMVGDDYPSILQCLVYCHSAK